MITPFATCLHADGGDGLAHLRHPRASRVNAFLRSMRAPRGTMQRRQLVAAPAAIATKESDSVQGGPSEGRHHVASHGIPSRMGTGRATAACITALVLERAGIAVAT